MRTLFIGGTKRGYLTLKALIERGVQVVGIISLQQDAHEIERYEEPIAALAQSHNVPVFTTKFMKERNYVQLIKDELKADLAIAVGVRVLISEDVHSSPRLGTIAIHDSLLPEYRGFAPLNWSIINGAAETGVTAFFLDERMDGGDIVQQIRVPIDACDTAPTVYEKICQATVELVLRICELFDSGAHVERIVQNYEQGSFTCSRIPADGMIDWDAPTLTIYNLVRALTHPYPGAFTFYKNQRLFVLKAQPVPDAPAYVGRIPGRVVGFSKPDGWVDVLTADGVLRLLEVCMEGQASLPASDVVASVKVNLGLDLFQLWVRVQELEKLYPRRASIPSLSMLSL